MLYSRHLRVKLIPSKTINGEDLPSNCTLDLSLFIRSLATLAFNVNESLGSFIFLTFGIHKPRSYIGLRKRVDRNK